MGVVHGIFGRGTLVKVHTREKKQRSNAHLKFKVLILTRQPKNLDGRLRNVGIEYSVREELILTEEGVREVE